MVLLRRKKRPQKADKPVPAKRFNEMIDYYTAELTSRLNEIDRLREQNTMIMKTAVKQSDRESELLDRIKKLREELDDLKKSKDI